MCAQLFQSRRTLCDSTHYTHQAPLSMGFSRQEYWSGLPGIPLGISSTAGDFFTTEPLGKPVINYDINKL